MTDSYKIVFGTKCAPVERIFSDIKSAGIGAVELYLSKAILKDTNKIIDLCKKYSFRYAVHAPTDEYNPRRLASLVKAVNAGIVIFHNMYWEDEWKKIMSVFKNIKARLCVENIANVNETLKFMLRYNLGRCLDLEHLQMEAAGIYEDEFVRVMKESSHVHISGYFYGSNLWHTHAHHSPENSVRLLNLLKKSGYSGLVVSEAMVSQQNLEEFAKLNDFYNSWKEGRPRS